MVKDGLLFDDKDALLSAIAEDRFRKLDSLMNRARDLPQMSGAERLRAALIFYLEFGRSHPHHIDLMFGAPARVKPADLQKIDCPDLVRRFGQSGAVYNGRGRFSECPRSANGCPGDLGAGSRPLVLSRHGELGDMIEGSAHEDVALRAITATVDAILPR